MAYSIPSLVRFEQLLDPVKFLYFKNRIKISRYFRLKYKLFSRQSIPQNSFCFTLKVHMGYSIPSLVRFGQLLDPVKFLYF